MARNGKDESRAGEDQSNANVLLEQSAILTLKEGAKFYFAYRMDHVRIRRNVTMPKLALIQGRG